MLNVKAIGYRVIIKPDPVEEVSSGGIVLAINKNRERAEVQRGTVYDIGPYAWMNTLYGYGTPDWKPWCKVGDRVWYSKYGGKILVDQEGDKEVTYVILNDEDIQCLITEEPTNKKQGDTDG